MKNIIVFISIITLFITLTACGENEAVKYVDAEQNVVTLNNDENVNAVCENNKINIEELTNDELISHVICLMVNDLPIKAKEAILSQNKPEDKVISFLLDCASVLSNSTSTPDDYSDLLGRVDDTMMLVSNKESIHKLGDLGDLIYNSWEKLHNEEIEKRDLEYAKEIQEHNKKYYDPKIGMTAEKVEKSKWGKPKDKNKTTTAYGVSEQWVYYGYKYIYFEDGFVTSISE
ncbi:putative small lipoprotein YifL [Paenibacillus endophyticus]|uniref:Putative small lipoprotein YifL n=1 Tax=Paenibacillus endophyticus TaxID=1294268 RepID=A0A7W5CBF9_9BACL|nr:hypothetical protein [Paenibacillus endophyticus]MBB3154492.1 putative small lipoprotein YifL [Paenibacillus endophyticus]